MLVKVRDDSFVALFDNRGVVECESLALRRQVQAGFPRIEANAFGDRVQKLKLVRLRRGQAIRRDCRGGGDRRGQIVLLRGVSRVSWQLGLVRLLDQLGVQGTFDCVLDRLLAMRLLDLEQLLAPLRLTKVLLQALSTAFRVVLLA